MKSKDFTQWHTLKTTLQAGHAKPVHFREQQIWWAAVGCNIGFEEDGKGRDFLRPVLMLLLSQMKAFDSRRLKYQDGQLDEHTFHIVQLRMARIICPKTKSNPLHLGEGGLMTSRL